MEVQKTELWKLIQSGDYHIRLRLMWRDFRVGVIEYQNGVYRFHFDQDLVKAAEPHGFVNITGMKIEETYEGSEPPLFLRLRIPSPSRRDLTEKYGMEVNEDTLIDWLLISGGKRMKDEFSINLMST